MQVLLHFLKLRMRLQVNFCGNRANFCNSIYFKYCTIVDVCGCFVNYLPRAAYIISGTFNDIQFGIKCGPVHRGTFSTFHQGFSCRSTMLHGAVIQDDVRTYYDSHACEA